MTALSLGWKLIGLSFAMLSVTLLLGAFASTLESQRMRQLRRVSVGFAIVAAITLIVVVIVGPGPWCGPGDAYEVPGCA